MSKQEETTQMGFKTSAIVLGLLMIVMWTLAFFVGQLLPSFVPAATPIAINWGFYFIGLLVLIVMTVVLVVLHVLWKLAHVGEKSIY
jgi:hypothetical protein